MTTWRKSSYSSPQGNCLEVADFDNHRAVRDSKNPTGPALMVTVTEWARLPPEYAPAKFD